MRVALVALLVACGDPPVEVQPCPTLSYALGVVYTLGGPLPLDGTVDGTLATSGPRFRAHPVAVPPRGALTLALSTSFQSGPKQPAIYAYGPRDAAGIFGTCSASAVGGALTLEVPEGQGGEWLVLVGADPQVDAKGSYTLTAACTGDACDEPVCSALLATSCETEVCPTGFVTETTADGLTCPTCVCEQPECGAFRTAVFDTCVCDCQVPLNPAPICGSDGVTYETECFAECAEVPVAHTDGACETACEPLTGCTLECPDGYAVENGCSVCRCAASCEREPALWRPVCGTDGLTYLNTARLACENAARPGSEAVAVAYVGHCLPNCPARSDCTTSCAFGHAPALLDREDLSPTCHSCDCAAPPVLGDNGVPDPFWCAFAKLEGVTSLNYVERLSIFRTFVSRDAAKALGFTPLFADPCPTSVCSEDADCADAGAILADQLRLQGGGEVPVVCGKGKIAGRVCRALSSPRCNTDADCLVGGTCSGEGDDRVCNYECACLGRPNAPTYDPICAMKDGVATTYFNPCVANCLGAWPVLHPGTCCDARLPNHERSALFQSLFPICKDAGFGQVPRHFQETACPPALAACEAEPALCCHDDAPAPPARP